MIRLKLLNLWRWFQYHFISWGVLGFIYSATAAVILQPVLEGGLKTEIPFLWICFGLMGLVLLPSFLEYLPLGGWKFGVPSSVNTFSKLYVRHEFRKKTTWLAWILTLGVLFWVWDHWPKLSVFLVLFMVQRALYQVHEWRRLLISREGPDHSGALVHAMLWSQGIQFGVLWVVLGCLKGFSGDWFTIGLASFAAVLAASASCLEGDSGRPWLVNFISFAAGAFGGVLTLLSGWLLLAVMYYCSTVFRLSQNRLRSVENLDDDLVIQ